MRELLVSNVNEAYRRGIPLILREGVHRPSRNGPTLELPYPLCTTYLAPRERVLFAPTRDANPFFHLFEALWMLAGRDDVATPARFVRRMRQYSDDGVTLSGAYGRRWRAYGDEWSRDQLRETIDRLRADKDDRRAVIAMYDASVDGRSVNERDVPCNLVAVPRVRESTLELTVLCRSNDMLWGGWGANAVQFSFLQEALACALGIHVGIYRQISNSAHLYVDSLPKYGIERYAPLDPARFADDDPYIQHPVAVRVSVPLLTAPVTFEAELNRTVDLLLVASNQSLARELRGAVFQNEFFPGVVLPLLRAWNYHVAGDEEEALRAASEPDRTGVGSDWSLAAQQWLLRRVRGKSTAGENGGKKNEI